MVKEETKLSEQFMKNIISLTLSMIGAMSLSFPLVKTGDMTILIPFHCSPLSIVSMLQNMSFSGLVRSISNILERNSILHIDDLSCT